MNLNRWLTVGTLAAGAVIVVLIVRGCDTKPTKVEKRVDSTLATVPAWEDTVRARDARLARYDRIIKRLVDTSTAQRARADSAEAKADSLQQWADDLAEVPTNLPPVEQNKMLRVALAAQKAAGVQFQVTVSRLKAQRTTDSLRLHSADSTLTQMRQWRAEDLARIDTLTVQLSDLREEGKHRGQWKVLGAWLPPWMDEAILATGSAAVGVVVGYGIGKGS